MRAWTSIARVWSQLLVDCDDQLNQDATEQICQEYIFAQEFTCKRYSRPSLLVLSSSDVSSGPSSSTCTRHRTNVRS